MYTNITIIPCDGLASVDGRVFMGLDFSGIDDAATIHAIQWHDGKGEVEPEDCSGNIPVQGDADYQRVVLPYVRVWEAAKAEADKPAPAPTPEEQQAALIASYTNAVQRRLDDFARERGYDDMNSLVSYDGDESQRFAAEAATGKRLRSQTWTQCYAIMDAVLAGSREVPTLDELLAELPVLAWEGVVDVVC